MDKPNFRVEIDRGVHGINSVRIYDAGGFYRIYADLKAKRAECHVLIDGCGDNPAIIDINDNSDPLVTTDRHDETETGPSQIRIYGIPEDFELTGYVSRYSFVGLLIPRRKDDEPILLDVHHPKAGG